MDLEIYSFNILFKSGYENLTADFITKKKIQVFKKEADSKLREKVPGTFGYQVFVEKHTLIPKNRFTKVEIGLKFHLPKNVIIQIESIPNMSSRRLRIQETIIFVERNDQFISLKLENNSDQAIFINKGEPIAIFHFVITYPICFVY